MNADLTDRRGSELGTWRPASPPITAASFASLSSNGPIAVHFWAEWNKVDQQMDLAVQAIMPRLESWVRFYSANIDENVAWCGSLHVVSIPCVIVFVDGEPRRHVIGFRDDKTLAREILTGLTTESARKRPWWKPWRVKSA